MGDADDCTLFRELQDRALAGLAKDQTLVLNFGLIEPFTTAFYSCLLKIRRGRVIARKARLVLCRLSSEHLENLRPVSGGTAVRHRDYPRRKALRKARDRQSVLDIW